MIVKQSNCAQMSLDLHFGCRPFPGCGGLVHLRLAEKASAKLRKLIWLAKRWASCINRWHVSKLQLNAAGIRAKNVIHMSFTAVSCLLCLGCQRAIEVTCREWRHVLQTTDSQWTGWKQVDLTWFEYMQWWINLYLCNISWNLDTFWGVISEAAMVCMIKRLRDQNKNMLSVHVVSKAKPITLSGCDISNLNGIPGLPPPPGKL